MRKWVFLILILLLVVALFLLVRALLRPSGAWCCMQAGSACERVPAYQECALKGGKVFHADQNTCDALCALVPVE